ncbi:MAG TPA: riboflavin synthase [Candidatus Dormibacteraeota bacterium]|nr:riboflavin synthase [Candidatus Dormibacteraeota bacterium]
MFTGIIEQIGIIKSLEHTSQGGRVTITAKGVIASGLAISGSIAVSGCCLTVVERDAESFSADLSGETLRCTSFAELRAGSTVNLERPLTAGKELGGHFVQGHVDGIGRVVHLKPEGETWWLAVRVPDELARYIAMKGSIAIDGISLTIAGWREGVAELAIIPYTFAHTNLRHRTSGDAVNLECDILSKYIERLLQQERAPVKSRLSLERLAREGF